MSSVKLPIADRFKECFAAIRLTVKSAGRDTSGVAALEFAMIAPIMFFGLVGTLEMSQAITVDRRVTQISSTISDLVARERNSDTDPLDTAKLNGMMSIMDALIAPYDKTHLKVTVANIGARVDDAADTRVCWAHNHPNGGVNSYSANQPHTLPSGIVERGGSVVLAEVSYNYTPIIFGYFVKAAFPLKDTFYLKPRNGASIDFNGLKRDQVGSCVWTG
jgi:Flp pilus assembly protein TadG